MSNYPLSANPKLHSLYCKLIANDVSMQLPGDIEKVFVELDDGEIASLIGFASILSMSDIAKDKIYAYGIITRLISLYGLEMTSLVSAADIILSRLGNFPGRTLLRKRFLSNSRLSPTAPLRLSLERTVRETENSISQDEVTSIFLTDFQYDLYDALDIYNTVSVSAPTSAGKSFVLSLDLVRRLKKGGPACIVYVVPTRALIREVTIVLRKTLQRSGLQDVPVRSVPFPIDKINAPNGAVFVLTQERLMALLHSNDGDPWITTIFVDEAQSIQDRARGILLQSVIEIIIDKFPDVECCYASPLISNPEYIVDLFKSHRTDRGDKTVIELISPVAQNIILVSEVERKTHCIKCELLLDDECIDLGISKLKFPFRGSVFKRRAALARAVTKEGEAAIIFANRPSDTETLALALIEHEPVVSEVPQEIEEFIDFLKKEIHIDYPLIKTLPHGVGYHYGYMPSIVRGRVEDLFKEGILKFICCTSTLLQGVNLPARHIIIENPKRGNGKPMPRSDFLNLAGRAGRLLQEFHGNIWCMAPATWDEPCYQGEKLQIIHSAMSEVMGDGGTAIQRLIKGQESPEEKDIAEAAFGKIYCDYICTGKDLSETEYRTDQNSEALSVTNDICRSVRVTLPREILDINRSIRPDKLQQLYEYFVGQLDLSSLTPIKPGTKFANQRMESIIRIVQIVLAGVENDSYRYYSWLATQWIYNVPLSAIISDYIAHKRKNGESTKASELIRNLLKGLETDIRFRLVKHYIAYTSILSHVLIERGQLDAANSIEPFHVYLECGASDPVALNMMSLGLSRVTALAVCKILKVPEDASPEQCYKVIENMIANDAREYIGIPMLCIREIKHLVGS